MDLIDETTECLKKHLGSLRLLAFREDDRNNRRLLFDSDGFNVDSIRDHQPSCGDPDSKLVAEMIFGSTPTVCNGESVKLHQFKNPVRLMFTKIFPAHQLASSGTPSLHRNNPNVQRRFSVDPEHIAREQGITPSASLTTISKFSHSDLLSPRVSSDSRRSSESSEECEVLPALHRLRRQRIGIAVLFTIGLESQSESDPTVRRRVSFLCAQFPTIFSHIKTELQDVVLTAYCSRSSVVVLMQKAWQRYLSCMKSMVESTCRAHRWLRYFKLQWSSTFTHDDPTTESFINTLVNFGRKYDTKQTNFILSTLVAAILGMDQNADSAKQVTELRIRCNDIPVLVQLIEIIGYFLKFIITDFDRISIKALPVPLRRSLSSHSPTKSRGTLASFWNFVRKGSIRDRTISENVTVQDYPSEPMVSPNSAPSARSSPAPSLTPISIILVSEDGLNMDTDSVNDKQSESELRRKEMDDNAISISSSINSFASSPNIPGSGSGEDDEMTMNIFDGVDERPLPRTTVDVGQVTTMERFTPLCDDVEANHNFNDDEFARCRMADVVISFSEFSCGAETGKQTLIVDLTTWKIYQTCMDESLSNSTANTCNIHFPSALVTEMMENIRMLCEQRFDAAFCLMYLEDGLKTLLSRAKVLMDLSYDGNDKNELRSEFCAKVFQCDISDLSFLIN